MQQHSFRALSSVYGKITRVLLSYPKNGGEKELIHHRYEGIFKSLPIHAQFLILADYRKEPLQLNDRKSFKGNSFDFDGIKYVKDTVASEFLKSIPYGQDRLRGVIIEPLIEFSGSTKEHVQTSGTIDRRSPKIKRLIASEWAQDPFIVLRNPTGTHALLEPLGSIHLSAVNVGDLLMAEFVTAQSENLLKPFKYHVTGGNVLVGHDYILVGTGELSKNLHTYRNHTVEQLSAAFAKQFGVSHVIWIGGNTTEAYTQHSDTPSRFDLTPRVGHIDMMMNLGGRGADGRELVFLAKLTDNSCFAISDRDKQKLSDYLDNVQRQLESIDLNGLKFRVVRVPLVYSNVGGHEVKMSYNNCLVEVYDNVKNIYLPQYRPRSDNYSREQLERLLDVEREVISTYEHCGFRVIMVPGDFVNRARSRGALHCIAKVMRRSFSPIDFGFNETGQSMPTLPDDTH